MTATISDSTPAAHWKTATRERTAGGAVVHGRAAEQKAIRGLVLRRQYGRSQA